ncbi:hypothetical protein IEU95_09665 [Hoyosella rhizosphaerae]|uniref:condensation domain-containing protein n=1 Tax=Hoyosella rhizosphaerae TaxID=1755582 RepID=UPI00166AA74C|nr:condensation domain-containing protein [Hoyosella rhizosphaerae]MBN4927099.1 hypothetical protein [Hoyosella rhizosphaerae]
MDIPSVKRATQTTRDDTLLPLTSAQSAAWFAQRMNPHTPDCIARYVDIHTAHGDDAINAEALSIEALRAAITQASLECALSTVRITERNGWPYQQLDSQHLHIHQVDLREEPDPVAAAHDWMCLHRSTPVDTNREALFSTALLIVADNRTLWYFRAHRVIADPAGVVVYQRRTAAIYSALVAERSIPTFRGLTIAHTVEHDRRYSSTDRFGSDHAFWAEQLSGVRAPISFAGKTAPASVATIRSTATLSPSTLEAVNAVAQYAGATVGSAVTAAFIAYFTRITGSTDPTITFPVTARTTMALRHSPGVLANLVPLRPSITESSTVADTLRQTRRCVADAVRHQQYRVDDIVRELGVIGPQATHFGPTVNVAFGDPTLSFGSTTAVINALTDGLVYDLTVNIHFDAHDALIIEFEANPALYGEAEVASHHQRFMTFLHAFATVDPDTTLNRVPGVRPQFQVIQ